MGDIRWEGVRREGRRMMATSSLDHLLGLLRVRVVRGVNLAVRDVRSSDPYIVLTMGNQKLKTRVIKKSVNPEWHEDLTFSIEDPCQTIKLRVYDHDTFSQDDTMGEADFDIQTFVDTARMEGLNDVEDGTVLRKMEPCRQNCLAEESKIIWSEGRVIQNLYLRLRNVECGEVELQLQWIDLHSVNSIRSF